MIEEVFNSQQVAENVLVLGELHFRHTFSQNYELVASKANEVLPHDSTEPLEEHYYTARDTLFKTKIVNGVASMTTVIEYVGPRTCVIDAVQGLAYKCDDDKYSTIDLRRDLAETVLPKPIYSQRPSSLTGHE
ncbi:hypothetical protein, partial [Mammaliicoccus sciuri]|uniref:hypothetical protein n=1 Tax=Mammaliicoccus sciuri TaxID=1296 RepID=UPI0019531555